VAERRETLKIIGAIGVSCMFPYEADELYGQHVHADGGPAPLPAKPKVFRKADFALLSRITDLILPATDTPGALGAGVPFYIDYVVSANADLAREFQTGLSWFRSKRFGSLSEARQIELLEDLSKRAESGGKGAPERFWRTIKSMTADGYYTSRIGLRDELGYLGNTVLDRFPESQVPEH
jgi:hypothetical protein